MRDDHDVLDDFIQSTTNIEQLVIRGSNLGSYAFLVRLRPKPDLAAGEPGDGSVDGSERRRRWSTDEKLAMAQESFEPGRTVSIVACQHDVNPNQLITDASFARTAACPL
jgi:hypothetical protein